MIWTSSNLDILASANARAQTPQQLNDWFFSPAESRAPVIPAQHFPWGDRSASW